MSEFKGTPGPWDYFIGNGDGKGLIRIEGRCDGPAAGEHIASMVRGPKSEANARMMAYAPEMFEACQAMLRFDDVRLKDSDSVLTEDRTEMMLAYADAIQRARVISNILALGESPQ